MVGHACPDGVEHSDNRTAYELLADAPDAIREQDGDVETGQITGAADDDVANGCVPQGLERSLAFAETDLAEDDGLIQVNTIEGYVAVLLSALRIANCDSL